MYRSTWELDIYARHHAAALADLRRACSPVEQGTLAPARLGVQLRHRLGMSLIQAGRVQAGCDAVRALPAAPRAATWGHSGS
jgi:hypothetical protein